MMWIGGKDEWDRFARMWRYVAIEYSIHECGYRVSFA